MLISTVISSAIAKPRNNWDLRHNEATTQDIVALILWADDRVKADTKNFAHDRLQISRKQHDLPRLL